MTRPFLFGNTFVSHTHILLPTFKGIPYLQGSYTYYQNIGNEQRVGTYVFSRNCGRESDGAARAYRHIRVTILPRDNGISSTKLPFAGSLKESSSNLYAAFVSFLRQRHVRIMYMHFGHIGATITDFRISYEV